MTEEEVASAAAAVAARAAEAQVPGRMPAIYLGHGAPPLLDDALWVAELAAWAGGAAAAERRAHGLGALDAGAAHARRDGGRRAAHLRLLRLPGPVLPGALPGAAGPELARRVADLAGGEQAVAHEPTRGLDHGAYVPLVAMYPDADVPVLQLSLPTLDPERLLELGARLRPLRDEGVLIIGSGFMTHGLPSSASSSWTRRRRTGRWTSTSGWRRTSRCTT